MTLADYLAKNYLSADAPSKGKKRKRKAAEAAGITIADDESTAWGSSRSKAHAEDDDDDAPIVVPGAGKYSDKKTTWKTIGVAAPSNSEQAAADAILADAAADYQSRARADDDAPAIVGEDDHADYGLEDDINGSGPKMSSGALAGLQSASQITAALKRRELEEKKAMEEAGLDAGGKAQETIYRDASGRIINVAMKRAELRRKAEEEERKRAEEIEGRVGDVQRRDKERRKKELDDAKLLKVARYADDAELNAELKSKQLWNDPAAGFISTTDSAVGSKTKTKTSRKKLYLGASEPNRYGIKPGYRWDGVDRSIGFERRWFEARNRQASNKEAEYAWQMDE